MLGVRARQMRSFRAPPVMDQLTCTGFFFLIYGPKSLTVEQVFLWVLEPASALKALAWTSAQATDCDLQSRFRKSISVWCLSPSVSPSLSLVVSLLLFLSLSSSLFLFLFLLSVSSSSSSLSSFHVFNFPYFFDYFHNFTSNQARFFSFHAVFCLNKLLGQFGLQRTQKPMRKKGPIKK